MNIESTDSITSSEGLHIIVTGASGFLGTHLCEFLSNLGHQITALNSTNCDLYDYSNLKKFSNQKYDLIYHLAVWTQAGDFCLNHPGEQWLNNQLINTNIIKWWYKEQSQAKFVFMGTSCAYANDTNFVEEEYTNGLPNETMISYGMTKQMLYLGAAAMQKQYGLNYMGFIPSTLYGNEYHTDGRQLHFIFDLIRKIIRGKELGEEVILWGDGYQTRDLIHVEDFIKLMWKVNKISNNELINIGAGRGYSIRYFAEILCKLINYPTSAIKYNTDAFVGVKHKALNVSKAKSLLGDTYILEPIESGLEKTVQWYYDNKAY